MNIFNLLPIMLYKTAVLGVGAAEYFYLYYDVQEKDR